MSKLNVALATLLQKIEARLNQNLNAVQGNLQKEIDSIRAENDKREAQQTLRDQNNVQALVNLRDSTMRGFNQVRSDVESILRSIQRLNERVGQVESQNLAIAAQAKSALMHATVNKIEPRPANPLPSDHVWVNKKLTGVYDSILELEERAAKIEKLLALYENLRKAQNAFAVANGEFLAGPKT